MSKHSYTGIPNRQQFWNPQSLGYKFLAEARRLWELERESGAITLPMAQSAALLNIEYNHNGMDKVGYASLKQAITMARDLGIFDADVQAQIRSKQMRKAREFFAWALFSWTA